MRVHVAAVIAALTLDEQRAISALDEFYGRGPGHLVASLNFTIGKARAVLRSLRHHGVADYGSLFDEDSGLVNGRGYWLGTFGQAVRDHLQRKEHTA